MKITDEQFKAILTASEGNLAGHWDSVFHIGVLNGGSTKRHLVDADGLTLCGKGYKMAAYIGDRVKTDADCDCTECIHFFNNPMAY